MNMPPKADDEFVSGVALRFMDVLVRAGPILALALAMLCHRVFSQIGRAHV